MSSKIIGLESEHFANIVVEAIQSIKTINDVCDVRYPRRAVSILKQHGKSAKETELVHGFALNCVRASQAMPTHIKNPKIALLDFDLRATKMRMGVQVVITDANQAAGIKRRELDVTAERIQKIIASGANVILTTCGIEDAMMKYMVEAGVLGVRRCKKDDLKRIAKVTGGTLVSTMVDLEGEENFKPQWLGNAELIAERQFCDDQCIVIEGTPESPSATIICRGANIYMLDEMERALNDALWAVARTLEAETVVAGGGAVEAAVSAHLENFASVLGTREQDAIQEFADALLVIPKTLAMNAALDASDLLAHLRVDHVTAQRNRSNADAWKKRFVGLDLFNGVTKNNIDAGVLEPGPSKIKSLQFATEAAITIIRIDDRITLNPKEEEDPRAMR